MHSLSSRRNLSINYTLYRLFNNKVREHAFYIEKTQILLKEIAVFDTFFCIVR